MSLGNICNAIIFTLRCWQYELKGPFQPKCWLFLICSGKFLEGQRSNLSTEAPTELIGIYCLSRGPNKGAWTLIVQFKRSHWTLWRPDAQDAVESHYLFFEHHFTIFQLCLLELFCLLHCHDKCNSSCSEACFLSERSTTCVCWGSHPHLYLRYSTLVMVR